MESNRRCYAGPTVAPSPQLGVGAPVEGMYDQGGGGPGPDPPALVARVPVVVQPVLMRATSPSLPAQCVCDFYQCNFVNLKKL